MPLLLYTGPLSLFSRKVEIALHEKAVPFERVVAPFTQDRGYSPKLPEVLAVNPKGQVPVLVDGDLQIFDSTVILEYIEDAYPTPPLYPKTPADRARCRLLELFADEIMLVPLRCLMFRTERARDPQRRAEQEAAAASAEALIASQYDELEGRLAGADFLCGQFSVADIAVFMSLLYSLRLGGPSLTANPGLAAWFARLAGRRAFAQMVSEIIAADRELSTPVAGALEALAAAIGRDLRR